MECSVILKKSCMYQNALRENVLIWKVNPFLEQLVKIINTKQNWAFEKSPLNGLSSTSC